jgi:hypothetical protein
MRRGLSPVTVGFGVIAILLLAVTVFHVAGRPVGAPLPSTSASASTPAHESQAAPGPTAALPSLPTTIPGETIRNGPEALGAELAPKLEPATAEAAALLPTGVQQVDAASADAAGRLDERRRALLIAAHNQSLRQEADERVFASRKLSETARDAIRQLNATYAETTRAFLERADGLALPSGRGTVSPEAEQRRRAALDGVLGPEEARSFETAERLAARALVPRYRRQWSRELHESGEAAVKSAPPVSEPPSDESQAP